MSARNEDALMDHLLEIAKIDLVSGAAYIYREQQQRYLPIKFSVLDRDLGSAIREAKARIADPRTGVKFPPGYRIEWSGEFAQMQEAFGKLKWLVPLSIGLILLLLHLFELFRFYLF